MGDIKNSGFIAIVGRPNVGKSTLLNRLAGQKVAIVSPKPQTTRNRILAVVNKDSTQMVFIDTPGFHVPKTRLGNYMMKVVRESMADVDCALLMIEPRNTPQPDELELIKRLADRKIPTILVINKIDTAPKEKLLSVIASYAELLDFIAVIPISALKGDGTEALTGEIMKLMPEGPEFYPQDMVSDQPERHIIAEIIREKMLMFLNEEVPHGTAVEIESMEDGDEIVRIGACVYCEKQSHKGIIIGKRGEMIKKIGTHARRDIEELLDCEVYLEIFVKTRADWRNREGTLRELGFGSY